MIDLYSKERVTQGNIMKTFLVAFVFIFIILHDTTPQTYFDGVSPQPRCAYVRAIYSSMFHITPETKIYIDSQSALLQYALRLNRGIAARGGDTLEIAPRGDSLDVFGVHLGVSDGLVNEYLSETPDQKIQITPEYPGAEGYVVDVFPTNAIICGSDAAGLYYGINTFLKLLDMSDAFSVFACRIVDKPEFPVRWYYKSTNVQVADNVTEVIELISRAAMSNLNGMALADGKLNRMTSLPDRYYDSLKSINKLCRENHVGLIPGIMPFGYCGSMLFFDPNLASGLPVYSQKFVIENDIGKLVPTVDVSLSNGGFEDHDGNGFPGFRWIDGEGTISFADTEVKHSGNTSIRFENWAEHDPDHGLGRIIHEITVSPFKQYHLSAWVKTENLSPASSFNMLAICKGNSTARSYYEPSIPYTTDGWQKVDITFNSLEYDTVYVYWGVWGARYGKIWIDDVALEESAFINMIRRDGAPLNVSHQILDLAYSEGADYDTLRDEKLGNYRWPGDYDIYHEPPIFRRNPNGNIRNGDTLLLSYYHTTIIGRSQMMITMSDPKVYEIVEREFRFLDSLIDADTYFMQHDEIRLMNRDHGDKIRNITPAEILADNVAKCVDIITRNAPGADYWVWSDMFDEYHNAVPGPYYLVDGDLRGSADLIPKSLGVVNWNSQTRDDKVFNSLEFFNEKGFRQISAPYYDQDENQIRRWKEWTQYLPDFHGMLYTTWQNKYQHLEHFAEYAWNHAPYVYFYPPTGRPAGETPLSVAIRGDQWDEDWALENVQFLYRTAPGMRFTSIQLKAETGSQNFVVDLPQDNEWMEYYIVASDNKGWVTRAPFGDTVYYEMGQIPSGVVDLDDAAGINIFGLYPNPAASGATVTIDWASAESGEVIMSLIGLPGNVISGSKLISTGDNNIIKTQFKLNSLAPGVYFLRMSSGKTQDIILFIVAY